MTQTAAALRAFALPRWISVRRAALMVHLVSLGSAVLRQAFVPIAAHTLNFVCAPTQVLWPMLASPMRLNPLMMRGPYNRLSPWVRLMVVCLRMLGARPHRRPRAAAAVRVARLAWILGCGLLPWWPCFVVGRGRDPKA